MQHEHLRIRLGIILITAIVLLSTAIFFYVLRVKATSRASDNWDPGWRPANGAGEKSTYDPTNRR